MTALSRRFPAIHSFVARVPAVRPPIVLVPVVLALWAGASGCASWRPTSDPARVVRGPLATRNQHPVALTLLHMRPRRATVQPKGKLGGAVDMSYSSMFEVEREPGETVNFDGEILRTAGRARYGLGGRTDLEVELAVMFTSSGFMDSFIDEFHNIFEFPDAGRENAEDDQYSMRLRRNGELIYELEEDRVGFGDVPIVVTHQVREENAGGPAVAVRAGVELPTGSEDRGFGNGKLDWGVGSLVERSLGRWTMTAAVDILLPGNPDAFDRGGVELNDILSLQVGGEYRWNNRLSLLGQLFWTSPMTDDYSVEEFDSEIFDLGLGLAYDWKGGPRLYVAIQEDMLAATGPDFGVIMGLSWGF